MKKAIAVILTIVMVLLCACGKGGNANSDDQASGSVSSDADSGADRDNTGKTEPDAGASSKDAAVSVSLERIGVITDEDFSPDDIVGYDSSTKKYSVCDYLGENKLNDVYDTAEYVNGSDGLYIVAKADKMPNGVGLVGMDGTVYIDCSASGIQPLSDRFFSVYFAEKEVTEKEDALFYFGNHSFTLDPEEGDTLYAGYGMVYDLDAGAFVPDVKITTQGASFYAIHPDCLCIEDPGYVVSAVFDADGKPVSGLPDAKLRYMNGYLYCSDAGRTDVFDGTGSKLFSTELHLDRIYEGKYYSSFEDDVYRLYDAEGNPVSDIGFKYSPFYNGSFFWEKRPGEDTEGCIDTAGNIIVDFDAEAIQEAEAGFLVAFYPDDQYVMIGKNGAVFKGLQKGGLYSVSVKENGDGQAVYILKDGDYTLKLNDVSWGSAEFIAVDRDADSRLFAAYETVTGAKLLDYQFSRIEQPNNVNVLYCEKEDGSWEVYRINIDTGR